MQRNHKPLRAIPPFLAGIARKASAVEWIWLLASDNYLERRLLHEGMLLGG
jgi:hypothetical protein